MLMRVRRVGLFHICLVVMAGWCLLNLSFLSNRFAINLVAVEVNRSLMMGDSARTAIGIIDLLPAYDEQSLRWRGFANALAGRWEVAGFALRQFGATARVQQRDLLKQALVHHALELASAGQLE